MHAVRIGINGFWISLLVLLSSFINAADFYISDVSETTQDNAPALVIRLTGAVDPGTDLSRYISVTPAPADGSQWYTQGTGRQWVLPFVEPSTRYQVKVTKPLTSVSGDVLSKVDSRGDSHAFNWTVDTRALTPGASFASSGTFLVGNIKDGIPVTVVNQPEVDLDVFRVRDQDMNRFIGETYFKGRMYYDSLSGLREYADLVHTARYTNQARANQRTTYNFSLDPVLEKKEPGIYVAVIRQPGEYAYRYDTTYFTITDIGLHVRKYKQSLMVYANSITTGEPLKNVNLRFWWRERNNQTAREQSARTSQNGSYQLSTNDLPNIIIAEQGDQISFLRLDQGELDLSSYPNVPSLHQPFQAFLYGPRDLYRPGEQVDINMLLRDFDGRKVRNMPLKAFLWNARGEQKQKFTWSPNDSGLYQTRFELDENAPTGDWRLEVRIDGQYEAYHFQVEEFLPETLTLSFYDGDRNQTRYTPKGEFQVPIQGDYLYGAPAAGNDADAVVTVSPANKIFPDLKGFYFGDSEANVRTRNTNLDPIKLDNSGHGELVVPDYWSDIKVPLNFSISASVYENGGRPITRTQNVIQLPAYSKLPGVQPQFEDRPPSNQTLQFKLLSVDASGEPVRDTLNVRLLRDHREYFWQYDSSRGWYWDYQANRYVTASETIEVKDQPVTVDFPVEWGRYDLEVTSSSGAITLYHFRTQWSWSNQESTNLKPDMIQMSLDQSHYAPGDTARLRLNSPISGSAIINVESSDGVEYTLNQSVYKGENQVSVELPKQWNRHDLYLTAMVLTPADQVSEVAPTRALGIIHLPLRRSDAVAEVELTTPEKIEPNKLVSAHLKVTNRDQLGSQKLFATVALVDKGVLNITRYQAPKPEQYFFAPRRFEASYYDIYGKIINNLGYDMIRQRFGGDMFADAMEMAELSRGGEKPKTEVQIVSFFSEPVELVDGEADVSFQLPNFNGKLEWMVVVFGDDSYGSAQSETIVADKVVTQISMPRFIAMGDQSQLSFDLHNLSGMNQQLDVTVNVSGEIFSTGLKQTVTLADRQKAVIPVPITGGLHEGQGVIHLQASNGSDINVDRTWKLGVRSPFPWQTEYQSAVIDANGSWQPQVDISNLRPDTVQALMTVSNRPAINFRSHLEYLLHYPYGCLEQTTSSTYPWVLLDTATVQDLGLTDSFKNRFDQPFSDEFRLQQIAAGIERLKSKQFANGGFGYWDAASSESRWGTAYATEVLVDARRQGVKVDSDTLDRALKRLDSYLRANAFDDDGWSDSNEYYGFAVRAYSAYVMAKAGTANLSLVRRLYDDGMENQNDRRSVRARIRSSGLAWMHLAAALNLLNDHDRAKRANDAALSIKRERYRYYRDYGSTMRDTALSLAIALEQGLDEGSLAQDLVDILQNERWFSTQERIALAKVALFYSKSGKQWQGKLIAKTAQQTLNQNRPFNTLLDADQLTSLQQVEAVDQKLYATLAYQGAPRTAPEPYSNGLHIVRRYYDLNGQRITPSNLTSGELIVVGLTISTDENLRIPDALVVDLLPAGLELENQNLSNASVDLDNVKIDDESLGHYFREYRTQYQEYRDDRYVAAISVDSWSSTKLYYLVRAVTPGTYQVPNPYVEDMYRPNYRSVGTTLDTLVIQPR
ncbi:alpha-2-macroglobulin family protein [Gynuella sp.]|uniref:alpha-2-macroglobulin family protein n=1 Tax=Gynuella sp. TaxID=2969146 RepID=UPI003D13B607